MRIEHFAAAFPLWLAPEQIRILGLNDDILPYCQEIQAKFRAAGFRVSIDTQSANVKKKIRDAQLDLIPYMLVVGAKDKDQGGVSVRDRIDGDKGFMTTEAALAKLIEERDNRVIRQVQKTTLQATGSDAAEGNEY